MASPSLDVQSDGGYVSAWAWWGFGTGPTQWFDNAEGGASLEYDDIQGWRSFQSGTSGITTPVVLQPSSHLDLFPVWSVVRVQDMFADGSASANLIYGGLVNATYTWTTPYHPWGPPPTNPPPLPPYGWSDSGNWGGVVPGGSEPAYFGDDASTTEIELDIPVSINEVTFDSDASYTVSGSNTLTLAGTDPALYSITGSHTISAPVAIADDATIDTYATIDTDTNTLTSSAVSMTGGLAIAAGKTLTKSSPGTLTISGPQNHGAGAVLNVGISNSGGTQSGGTLNLNSDAGSATSANLTINIYGIPALVGQAGVDQSLAVSTVNFGSSQHLAALNVYGGGIANFLSNGQYLGAYNVYDGGIANFSGSSQQVGALNVHDGGKAVVTPAPSGGSKRTLVANQLSLSGGAKLDLSDNKLIIRKQGTTDAEAQAQRAEVLAQLAAGRNVAPGGLGDGNWNGSHGIVSSTAAAAFVNDGIESKAIGFGVSGQMPMGDPVIPGTSTPVFAGAQDGDILLRYTYNGDATLDGIVDDFDVIVQGSVYDGGLTTGHHWYEGDFNGDGKVDDSDVQILGAFYAPTAPPLDGAALTQQFGASFAHAFEAGEALRAVPEPATLSLLGLGAPGLLMRRRKARVVHG